MPDATRGGRLFLALPLPDDARQRLAERCRSLQPISWLRVAPPGNHHVTLQFFGEVPAERVAAAERVLVAVASRGAEAELTLGGFAALPPRGAPRVIYARPTGPTAGVEQLIRDARAVSREQGFAVDGRPPLPHVTVARSRRETRSGGHLSRPAAAGPAAQVAAPTWAPLPAHVRLPEAALRPWDTPLHVRLTAVSLYRSHLRAGGAEYEELATKPLRGAP